MNPIQPQPFSTTHPFPGLSEANLKDHHRLYIGYVTKYNELSARLTKMQANVGKFGNPDVQSLKVDLTYALSAIKNHELFFTSFNHEPASPPGELLDLIERDFGSLPAFMHDLRQTAFTSRGWAWTAYDIDHHHLFNYSGGAGQSLPVWNALPLLAIDLYGHAYLYDFGANRAAYVDAVLEHLNWENITARLEKGRALAAV